MRSLTQMFAVTALAAAAALLATDQGPGIAPAKAQANPACTLPTAPAATNDQTAWQLFVAINCQTNGKPAWASWIEQSQLYPTSGKAGARLAARAGHRFHGSVLAAIERRMHGKTGFATAALSPTQCNPMAVKVPNVLPGAVICEEVYINPTTQSEIAGPGYNIRTAQMKAAATGTKISFTSPSIEIKVDWLPASDFKTAPFACDGSTTNFYTEQVGGTCYALVAMHILSKLLPNWLWTTFEPQSAITNPFRCYIYGPCRDAWGATPAISNGPTSTTAMTPGLQALFTQAGLPATLQNYRLDVAQSEFTTPDGKAIQGGNSITEYEAVGTPQNQSSCITCHSMSSVNAKGTDGASLFASNPAPMGPEVVLPAGFIRRGFLWSLGLACPDPTKTGLQSCK